MCYHVFLSIQQVRSQTLLQFPSFLHLDTDSRVLCPFSEPKKLAKRNRRLGFGTYGIKGTQGGVESLRGSFFGGKSVWLFHYPAARRDVVLRVCQMFRVSYSVVHTVFTCCSLKVDRLDEKVVVDTQEKDTSCSQKSDDSCLPKE